MWGFLSFWLQQHFSDFLCNLFLCTSIFASTKNAKNFARTMKTLAIINKKGRWIV